MGEGGGGVVWLEKELPLLSELATKNLKKLAVLTNLSKISKLPKYAEYSGMLSKSKMVNHLRIYILCSSLSLFQSLE